jgi:hypothetical protein
VSPANLAVRSNCVGLPWRTAQVLQRILGLGLGAFFILTFGTDPSLTTSAGWDNVTGMDTPNGLALIRAVAK